MDLKSNFKSYFCFKNFITYFQAKLGKVEEIAYFKKFKKLFCTNTNKTNLNLIKKVVFATELCLIMLSINEN